MKKIILFLIACLPMTAFAQFSYDLQGHRGSRGLMPENSAVQDLKS